MFDYVLPGLTSTVRHAATRPGPPGKPDTGGGEDDGERDKDGRGPPRDPGQIQTQMVGEKPGDDLGYDPRIIPTEKIPD